MPEVGTPPVGEQLPPVTPPAGPLQDARTTKLEQDMAEMRRMTQQLGQNQQRQQQQPNQQLDELNKQFYREPVTTAAAIAQQAVNEAFARERAGSPAMSTLITFAQDKARAKNPELWDKYFDKIKAMVEGNVEPQYQQHLQPWEFARDKVFGQHMDEIIFAQQEIQTNRAPAVKVSAGGPGQPNGHQPPAAGTGADKLSAEEKQMARDLDISPESYAKGKEYLEGQNRKGKSTWDNVVTFSSKERKRALRAKRTNTAK